MGKYYECDPSMFAATLEDLLKDTIDPCNDNVRKAVEQSTREGVKTVRSKAGGTGKHPWSDRYIKGFRANIENGHYQTTGEIGNKNKPGLVHLLEKGHATLTGRRTKAYPHMAPAFEEIEQDFIERVEDAIDMALGG